MRSDCLTSGLAYLLLDLLLLLEGLLQLGLQVADLAQVLSSLDHTETERGQWAVDTDYNFHSG